MAELNEAQKLEIVTRLARFEAPMDILRDLGSRGVVVTPIQVGSYDPTRSYYEAGEKWREIFDAARKFYIEEVASVPLANQGFRLQTLARLVDKAEKEKKYGLVAQLIEQASKEVGGVFTNQRDVSISDSRRQSARDASPEDRKSMFAELVRQTLEQMPTVPGAEPAHPTTQ